jgi:hypothetical protein
MCISHESVTYNTYHGSKYIINIKNITREAKPRVPQINDNNDKRETDISATIGRELILECAAGGMPTPDIDWKYINQYGTEMPFPLPTTFAARNSTMQA